MKKISRSNLVILSTLSILLLAMIAPRVAAVSSSSECVPAGATGLTTVEVASSHQTIKGVSINAVGCDVGIYIGPGTNDVTIRNVKITGANDHGIFVQDASRISIKDSTVTGNGVARHACPTPFSPPPCIHEDKALQLVGTTDSVVSNNVVSRNVADGGIGVSDDGPAAVGGDPAALTASATSPQPSQDVRVTGNMIVDNTNGCGIVVAGYDVNVGVRNIEVRDNVIVGVAPATPAQLPPIGGPFGGPGAFYGQIVVAGDGPFTTVSNVKIVGNHLDGSLLPGIVLHANVFGDNITNTSVKDNTLNDNGWYPPFFVPPGDTNVPFSPDTTGISVVAEVGIFPSSLGPAPAISHTNIDSNTVSGDKIGVWLCGTDHTTISDLDGNSASPEITCQAGGS
jgi:parallel beta helix pectate lyase-like protein